MLIKIGDHVLYRETFKGNTWTKVGQVVDLDEVKGRARVLWSHWEFPDGSTRKDGKRTWMKGNRLMINTRTYEVAFKIDPCPVFPNGYSDVLGVTFKSIKAAKDYIADVQKDPASQSQIEQLKDAYLWVTDEKGTVVAE